MKTSNKHRPARSSRTGPLQACVALAFALFLLAGCHQEPPSNEARAVRGELDLRTSPLSGTESVALNGEWEFYWDRLLTPEDFGPGGTAPRPTGFFSLPGSWRGEQVEGRRLGSTGQATYRLTLLAGQDSGRLTLRLYDIHEAYRLWADGVLVAQSGVPGLSIETEQPARSLKLADIPLRGRPIELVLQVSNHHFRRGGVTEPILAALPGPLEQAQSRDWALSLFFAGSILIMGVYHLVLYAWRRQNPAPLYFGLYCLLVVGYCTTSNSSDWVARLAFPRWDAASMELFSLTCFVCWASLIFRFLKTIYPQEFHSFLVHFLDVRIPIFVLLAIFAPGPPVYWFIALCLVQTFAYATYYIYRLWLCVRRGRTGAGILLAGLGIQFLAGINDPLAHTGLINSIYLVEPAVFLFVLSQSLVLSKRFSRAFDSVERLSVELERNNASLHREMEQRNRLEKQLVSISEEERRQLSHELHDSLCQQLTGARLRASALAHEHAGNKDGPELAELAELLGASTREAYKVARGLHPVELGEAGPSLKNLADSIAKATGIDVSFKRRSHCAQCANGNIVPLYRIAQEALANAAKHSRAENIRVELACDGDGEITLTVNDDGVGLNLATPDDGLGTGIMHHRAKMIGARLRIENDPQGGTKVVCQAPCDATTKTTGDSHDG